MLARLLEENPTVVAAVLTAQEERQRVVELAEEEERLRWEAEKLVREIETAERAQEAAWAQESAMAFAKTRAEVNNLDRP